MNAWFKISKEQMGRTYLQADTFRASITDHQVVGLKIGNGTNTKDQAATSYSLDQDERHALIAFLQSIPDSEVG